MRGDKGLVWGYEGGTGWRYGVSFVCTTMLYVVCTWEDVFVLKRMLFMHKWALHIVCVRQSSASHLCMVG